MAKSVPKTKAGKRSKMKSVMDEWASGKLHSGSKTGPKVKSQRQAVAIGLKQSGQSKYGKSRRTKRAKA